MYRCVLNQHIRCLFVRILFIVIKDNNCSENVQVSDANIGRKIRSACRCLDERLNDVYKNKLFIVITKLNCGKMEMNQI